MRPGLGPQRTRYLLTGSGGPGCTVARRLPSPHAPSHSLPLAALSPHLVILDALHGELVAVHPQGVAEDGQPVKLLQLKGLGEKQGCCCRAGPGQAPLSSAGDDQPDPFC